MSAILPDVVRVDAIVTVHIPSSSFDRDCCISSNRGYFAGSGSRRCRHSGIVGSVGGFWHRRSRDIASPARDIIQYPQHCAQLAEIIPQWPDTVRSFWINQFATCSVALRRTPGLCLGANSVCAVHNWPYQSRYQARAGHPFICWRHPSIRLLFTKQVRWSPEPAVYLCRRHCHVDGLHPTTVKRSQDWDPVVQLTMSGRSTAKSDISHLW